MARTRSSLDSVLGFTRRSIPAISAHIVAPLTSSLQLHWLLRKDVAISKNATKLGALVSRLQSETRLENPNALSTRETWRHCQFRIGHHAGWITSIGHHLILLGGKQGLKTWCWFPTTQSSTTPRWKKQLLNHPLIFSTFANALVSICALLLQISRLFP